MTLPEFKLACLLAIQDDTKMVEDVFKKLDADGNGDLSLSEFKSGFSYLKMQINKKKQGDGSPELLCRCIPPRNPVPVWRQDAQLQGPQQYIVLCLVVQVEFVLCFESFDQPATLGDTFAGLNTSLRQVKKQKTELEASKKEIAKLRREAAAAKCVCCRFYCIDLT